MQGPPKQWTGLVRDEMAVTMCAAHFTRMTKTTLLPEDAPMTKPIALASPDLLASPAMPLQHLVSVETYLCEVQVNRPASPAEAVYALRQLHEHFVASGEFALADVCDELEARINNNIGFACSPEFSSGLFDLSGLLRRRLTRIPAPGTYRRETVGAR